MNISMNDHLALYAASRLSERDRTILRLLADHHVLTTPQIADVAFGSDRRARYRLAELYELRCVDRFRLRSARVGWGSAPYHWVIDLIGALIVAAERDLTPREVAPRPDRLLRLRLGGRLNHLIGVNAFFTALIRSARHHPGRELSRWWSERQCAAEWGGVVIPDGHGIWTQPPRAVSFLLEYDCGTENHARLAAKIRGYRNHPLLTAQPPAWLLIVLPSRRRETNTRRALTAAAAETGVHVATATEPRDTTPDAAIWLPLDDSRRRLRLIDLPDTAAPPRFPSPRLAES